ncbi:MAG TPA: PadR family transcriptional regulator [Acidimicrobiales bacterium]|nr:PadR family transcriptional regulator [Acidimicrobiales bacterium]
MAAKPLTTTSYALLAHLAVQPWSAYELAKQMTRGMDLVWPRAESAIYAEPKNLVAHGLARVADRPAGLRTRAVYSITPKGRRALAAWFATDPSPPQFESEALLRVFFAEQTGRGELVGAVESVGRFGRQVRERLVAQIQGYLDEDGPFPERWHVIALGSRFLLGLATWMEEWAGWAVGEVAGWPDGDPPEAAAVLAESLRLYGLRPEGSGPARVPDDAA